MLHAGFGTVDITPQPVDGPGGFRVYDPISFRATVLRDDATGEAVALLAGDFFSFEQNLHDLTCDALTDIDWLPREHVLVSVSHIGGAPILFPSYVHQPCEHLRAFGDEARFAHAAAEAVCAAAANMHPVRVGFDSATASGVSYNRRSYDSDGNLVMSNFMLPYPQAELRYEPTDDRVYTLRFDRTDESSGVGEHLGEPCGAIVSFGCHALCNSDKQGNVSADYPGVLRAVIENAWPDAGVSFLPGALGDVVPFHRGGRTYECVGNAVGGAALLALERTRTSADATLSVAQRTVRVPTHAPMSLAQATADYADNEADGSRRMNVYTARRAAEHDTVDYRMTAVRIGDGVVVHLPGEVFVRTASAIRDASPLTHTVIVSGPSADVGYLCPPEAHAEGGMEPKYTGVAGEAETMVRKAACEMLQSLAAKT